MPGAAALAGGAPSPPCLVWFVVGMRWVLASPPLFLHPKITQQLWVTQSLSAASLSTALGTCLVLPHWGLEERGIGPFGFALWRLPGRPAGMPTFRQRWLVDHPLALSPPALWVLVVVTDSGSKVQHPGSTTRLVTWGASVTPSLSCLLGKIR